MKSTISLVSLATLALATLSSATFTRSRQTCREKNGSCRTDLNKSGFTFKCGSLGSLCVPDGWKCGSGGVSCDNKPSEDYCPDNYSWFEHKIGHKSWKLCVPTSGDNYDDDDDPDCLEGATWKDGRCQVAPPSTTTCNLSTHFWWAEGSRCGKATTNRCVPRTTPSKAATPPSDEPSAVCPPYWHFVNFMSAKVCVPSSPHISSCKGKPSCPSTHSWNKDKGCCTKKHLRRSLSASGEILAIGAPDDTLCPAGLTSCPVGSSQGVIDGAWECIDPETELESCGGCTSMGTGQDCTAISNAKSVGCEAGVCKVYSCAKGFLHDNSCIV